MQKNPPFLGYSGYCLPSCKDSRQSKQREKRLLTNNCNTKKSRFVMRRLSNVGEAAPQKWQKNWPRESLI
jgi:hypothetical protein